MSTLPVLIVVYSAVIEQIEYGYYVVVCIIRVCMFQWGTSNVETYFTVVHRKARVPDLMYVDM
jgi:hypothetical protein